MKSFTIIEKKWARGGRGGESALLTNNGSKCCLGFLANACGFRRLCNAVTPFELADSDAMNGHPYSSEKVACSFSGLVRQVEGSVDNTELGSEIAEINDDESITDSERKQKLAPLFAKIGWKPVYK